MFGFFPKKKLEKGMIWFFFGWMGSFGGILDGFLHGMSSGWYLRFCLVQRLGGSVFRFVFVFRCLCLMVLGCVCSLVMLWDGFVNGTGFGVALEFFVSAVWKVLMVVRPSMFGFADTSHLTPQGLIVLLVRLSKNR